MVVASGALLFALLLEGGIQCIMMLPGKTYLLTTHFITEMIQRTSLTPWVSRFPIPGSLRSAFLRSRDAGYHGTGERERDSKRKSERERERER